MELLTEELKRKIPRSQEEAGKEAVVYAKFFCPWSNWTWYVTEATAFKDDEESTEIPLHEVTDDVPIEDIFFFGLVEGFEKELGSFSYKELMAIEGPGGLKIERDLHWEPCKLSGLL